VTKTDSVQGSARPPGRIKVHSNRKRGTYRLRLASVREDQLETILMALKKCRTEAGTEYDAVALYFICLSFLSGG